MVSFIKKDLLIFWRDRKEVLISLLAPILLIVILNFVFSGITFDDAGDMELHIGWVQEDEEAVGMARFEERLQEMGMPELEKEAMMEQAASLTPIGLMKSLFDHPEVSSWIHTHEIPEAEAIHQVEMVTSMRSLTFPKGLRLTF